MRGISRDAGYIFREVDDLLASSAVEYLVADLAIRLMARTHR